MTHTSYFVPFMDLVERTADPRDDWQVDPRDCWQEDGFWPERVKVDLDQLLVFGTLVGLGYLLNDGLIAYLEFISGRTLPEMKSGFGIIGCPLSEKACHEILRQFGSNFLRNDRRRGDFVRANETVFEQLYVELNHAMVSDNYEDQMESYCKSIYIANSTPPDFHPGA